LKSLRAFGNDKDPEMGSLAMTINKKEVRIGNDKLPFFSEVQIGRDIHTVKIRFGGYFIKEICFIGKTDGNTTQSICNGGSWKSFKVEEGECIIGMYGEQFESGLLNSFKTLGFILGKYYC